MRLVSISDISSESVAAARDRHRSDKMAGKGRRPPFTADFYVADCTSVCTCVCVCVNVCV